MNQNQKESVAIKKPGNQSFRHLKALMRKNRINWVRTWKGSIFELICPALLMLLLVWVRTLIKIEISDPSDVFIQQQPLYPLVALDATSGKWAINPASIAAQSKNLETFFTYTKYNSTNPYSFIPPHCIKGVPQQTPGGPKQTGFFNQPIIAVVSEGNKIEKDLIDQLNTLFEAQRAQEARLVAVNMRVQKFDSKDQLWQYLSDGRYGNSEMPGVCFGFRVFEYSPGQDYELELFFQDLFPSQYKSIPNQKNGIAAKASQKAPLQADYDLYLKGGYSMFQNWAANTILKSATGKENAQITAMVVPMKYEAVPIDFFPRVLQPTLQFFILIVFVPILYRMVSRVVAEKATRAKESMRMMGMGDGAYWLSWFIQWTISNLVLVTIMWAILMINVFSRQKGGFVWLFLFLYGQSLFGLLLIAQSLFSNSQTAAIWITGIYFLSNVVSVIFINDDTTYQTKVILSWFFPTVTMTNGVFPLADQYVSGGMGNPSVQVQNFSAGDSIWLFIVGGVNVFLIGLYLELVVPKTYGRQRHPCFFFTFCCKKGRANPQVSDGPHAGDEEKQTVFETKYMDPSRYEGVPREIALKEQENQILKISDLKKTFAGGLKAVQGVNLKMYTDQIFVLLGHNGAGKTTTINMLTGLYEQSAGTADLFGIDMFNDMNSVRQVMGVCPQHDILFELLTCEEHLSIFYDLKGADPKLKNQEIDKLLKDVGIWDKRKALASQLSGGNKRKLSVAIALCGNSKFVLLDEPTSGMDLSARRQLWNMLKEYKKDRIILLTTHYMDEADILGDRIAIMTSGKVAALGSSIFLKSTFGVGYNLTVVKKTSDKNETLMPYMREVLGEKVIQQSEIQQEMTIQIPTEYACKFAQFFEQFDQKLTMLGVQSYGISISTLEEVFLKVGHLDDKDAGSLIDKQKGAEESKQFNMCEDQDLLDTSFINNFWAIMLRKFYSYRGNKKGLLSDTLVPVVILLLGIILSKIQPDFQSDSRLQIPERLPLPQQLIMNPQPVISSSNVQVQTLVKYLGDAFSVKYDTDWSAQTNYKQYGDSIFDERLSTYPYMYGSYQIFEANTQSQQYKFMTFVNQTSQDATGLYPGFMYESILKVATNNPQFRFKTRNSPWPPTYPVQNRAAGESTSDVLFQMAIAYSQVIMAVVVYLVKERMNGLKHLQIISGMQLKAYWAANFVFDLLKWSFLIVTTIILWFAFEMGYVSAWAVLLMFPFAVIPLTYVTSFIFTDTSTAQTLTLVLHVAIMAIGTSVIFTFRVLPILQKDGDLIHGILKIIPSYMVGSAMYCDTACESLALQRKSPFAEGKELDGDRWAMTNNSLDIVLMFIHFVFWFILIVVIELGLFKICSFKANAEIEVVADDNDVINEANRVLDSRTDDTILVRGFKRVYETASDKKCRCPKKLVAVSDLSFGLKRGECFALLGVNGAGKTTTFKSLTGEVQPTSGSITVGGFDIRRQFEQARKLIGYCPQADLIYEDMTVEEHLAFYVQLKGIPKDERKSLVESSISQLGLGTHRKKPAGTLSGGNKRKLCVAIALIGNPQIILLDEPSAGMDPESRRFMWSVVGNIAQKKTSAVVLTTHSMDEAEALSTKMGIMVKGGVFRCFGSSQHIKNKFGTGYVIEIKIKTLKEEDLAQISQQYLPQGGISGEIGGTGGFSDKVKEEIRSSLNELNSQDLIRQAHLEVNLFSCISELCKTFGQIEVLEKYGSYVRVRVARLDKSIGFSFGLVEGMRAKYDISEYSVSQTTLEQIFQNFADVTFTENVKKYGLVESAQGMLLTEQ